MPSRPSPQGQSSDVTGQPSSGQPDLPQSYSMAAPLNEAELMALLMASPMYQKLEEIKKSVATGAHTQSTDKHKMEPGMEQCITVNSNLHKIVWAYNIDE